MGLGGCQLCVQILMLLVHLRISASTALHLSNFNVFRIVDRDDVCNGYHVAPYGLPIRSCALQHLAYLSSSVPYPCYLYFRIYLYLCIETADVQAARALSVRQHSEVSHAGALLLLAGSHIYL